MVSWMHPEKKAVSRLNSDALVTQLPSNSLLLCICTTLYNETLRCCFAIGEKNIKKLMINGELVIEWIKEKSIKDVVVENICYD